MKQGYVTGLAVVLTALLSGPAQAQTQLSEERIKELIREASKTSIETPTPSSSVQVPGEGPTVALTLDDAVRFALERNLDIAVQRLNPQLQDIAMATARAAFCSRRSPRRSAGPRRRSPPTSAIDLSSGGGGTKTGTTTYNGELSRS